MGCKHIEVNQVALKPLDRKLYERQYGFRDRGLWHTDVTAAINPPAAFVLRAVNVSSFGGDTQWTNLVVAYEGLSAPLRALADTLKGNTALMGTAISAGLNLQSALRLIP